MKQILLLLGPTLMIWIGLHVLKSVPITFLLFYGWLLLIPLLFQGRKTLRWGFRLKKRDVLVGLISGMVFLLAILGSVTILLDYLIDVPALQQILLDWGFTGNHVIGLIFVLLFINPVLEEWYWREFMYKRLLSKVGMISTVLITAGCYSLYHLLSVIPMFSAPLNVVSVLPVFIAGVIWAYFRYRFGHIGVSIMSHILADLGIILVYVFYIA
ncbi:CPBP family intramembrane glutamic endopeptidase [Bacillus sp. AK128]